MPIRTVSLMRSQRICWLVLTLSSCSTAGIPNGRHLSDLDTDEWNDLCGWTSELEVTGAADCNPDYDGFLGAHVYTYEGCMRFSTNNSTLQESTTVGEWAR